MANFKEKARMDYAGDFLELTDAILLVLLAAGSIWAFADDVFTYKIPWYLAFFVPVAAIAIILFLSKHPIE